MNRRTALMTLACLLPALAKAEELAKDCNKTELQFTNFTMTETDEPLITIRKRDGKDLIITVADIVKGLESK